MRTKKATRLTYKDKIKIGEVYHKLTVLEHIGKTPLGKPLYKCQCECGKQVDITVYNILSGHAKSCGCLAKYKIKGWGERKNPSTAASICHSIYHDYIKNASNRNLIFELDEEQFKMLSKQDCVYCGRPPHRTSSRNRSNLTYTYNGIDRIDNSRGYTLDNCVSCCTTCNLAKHTMNLDEFKK